MAQRFNGANNGRFGEKIRQQDNKGTREQDNIANGSKFLTMKELSLILIIFLSLISCNTSSKQVSDSRLQSGIQLIDTSDMTNNFYDNTETYALPVQELIEGEAFIVQLLLPVLSSGTFF